MTLSTDDHYLSVKDLANLLDVPVATIYSWRHTGDGPRGLRVGRHVRFARTDVELWLESCADRPRST